MTTTRPATRPEPATLHLPAHRDPVPTRTRLTTRRLPVLAYLAVLLLVPAAVVSASVAAGWWRTTGTSLTATSVEGVPAQAPAAPADPADVKGSMTVQAVVDAFPAVSVAQVLDAFGAPAGTPASTQLKTLVEGGTLDVPAFREWLAART